MNALAISDIRVPGGPEAPARVRSALERELGDEVDGERLAEVYLLATEVVTNSVRHGGVDADGWIHMSVAIDESHVRIEVRDSGVGGEPEVRSPNYDEGGGFGLFLVDKLAARWGVERGADLCVWFELAVA